MKFKIVVGSTAIGIFLLITLAIARQAESSGIEAVRAHKIVAVWHYADKAEMQESFEQHLDVLEFEYGRSVKFLTDAESLTRLQARGYDIKIELADIYEYHASRLAPTTMGGYRTFDEIVAVMDSLHDLNPAISTAKYSIGQTLEGREIWVMKISDNPDIDEDEPESFFNAAIHAREVVTPAVLLETMRTLIEGYGVDTFLTRLIDTRESYFMPCYNADGYTYNEQIAPNGGGMWRKNRRCEGTDTFGVDLNRNLPYAWSYDDYGSSPYRYDATYRGTGPASEPETQAFINFVENREFTVAVTVHTYSNLILWPYGYDYDIYSPDEDLFRAMGDSMSMFNGYTPTVSWGLYPANGVTDDWLYGEQTTKDKIFAFTFEVGSSADGHWPEPSRIPQLVSENIPPIMYLIDISANPYVAPEPLVPAWTMGDTVPSGFFNLTWSQPDNGNEVVGFDLIELSDPMIGVDGAEDGLAHWQANGFRLHSGVKYEGAYSFYSEAGDNLYHTMTSSYPVLVTDGDTLQFYTRYDIELDWDYAYVEVSTQSEIGFVTLPGNITTNYNPHGNNRGNGITGDSPGWVLAKFDLSAYAGQNIYLRFSYITDGAVAELGFFADVISPVAWFNKITTLAEDYSDSSYAIAARPAGDYFFRVNATDAEAQTGPFSTMKKINVASDVTYGDLDNDGSINPLDAVLLVAYVYKNQGTPVLWGAQYINGDNECNPNDVVWMVNYVYKFGPPPLGYGE